MLGLVRGRLTAPLVEDQARLQRALAAPFDAPPRVACTVLATDRPDRRLVVRTTPVVGAARDVFGLAVALAIVTVWEKPDLPPPASSARCARPLT